VTEYATVEVGSQAPDFSFESAPGWRRLRDLRTEGDLLLVFGADDAGLLALEREREGLRALDVVPVAIVDRKPGACRALVSRLQLGVRLVPDPQRVIGAQFNVLDPNSRADAPAWFVLDRTGRVHALGRWELPAAPWTKVAAAALGIDANPSSTVGFGGR
jgi:peroxiredoxin